MKVTELFKEGKFVVSAEVGPPKGFHIEEMIEGQREVKVFCYEDRAQAKYDALAEEMRSRAASILAETERLIAEIF